MRKLTKEEVTKQQVDLITSALNKTILDIKSMENGDAILLSLEGNGHMEIFTDNGTEFLRGKVIVYHDENMEFKSALVGVDLFDNEEEYMLAADEKSTEANTMEINCSRNGQIEFASPTAELDTLLAQAGIRKEGDHE